MIPKEFNLITYDYRVPPEFIAQTPDEVRDKCRLLVINRKSNAISQGVFTNVLNFFSAGDVLVINDTKVIKAKLIGKKPGAGKIEVLLVKEIAPNIWECLVKPGKRAKIGNNIEFDDFSVRIKANTMNGGRVLEFFCDDVYSLIERKGKAPLPPYIKKDVDDPQKYQTIYARKPGAIAAPTAGMHFTDELLAAIKEKGVQVVSITLHCGLATFRPVKTQDIRRHPMESEWIELSTETADVINQAKACGKQIVACGTTVIRVLETAVKEFEYGIFKSIAYNGLTNTYITPGYQFKIVDKVITNFHTPCSTNIILLSSFCGIDLLRKSYDYAAAQKFRFYSFGDATIVV